MFNPEDHWPKYWQEVVYAITYLPTGKKYVGKTRRPLSTRLYQHYLLLRKGAHTAADWQKDYNEYGGGLDAFAIEDVCIQRRKCYGRNRLPVNMEKQTMLALRTFDEQYGYNTHDPAMQTIRESKGLSPIYWTGAKAAVEKRKASA